MQLIVRNIVIARLLSERIFLIERFLRIKIILDHLILCIR
jgi:hypothetical protein